MWQSYLNGILVAAGLIIAIGAQNAFVLAQSLRREHHLSVAALCVFCDAVLVSLGVFGLAKLLLPRPRRGVAGPLAGAPGHLAPARPDGGGHDAGHGRATAVPGITRFPSSRANPRAARQSRENAAVFAGELAEARRSAPPPAFAPTVAAWICPDTGAMIRSSRHWEPRLRVAPGALSGALRRTSPRGSRTGSRTGIGPAP